MHIISGGDVKNLLNDVVEDVAKSYPFAEVSTLSYHQPGRQINIISS